MGNKKPMAELVVAPNIVIGVLMLWKAHEMMQDVHTKIIVHMKFSFGVNFLLRISSTESLFGRTQKGAANTTTSIMPKRAM